MNYGRYLRERFNNLNRNFQAEWIVPGNTPSDSWPGKGEINFVRYSTRYREGMDLVLRRITCDIKSGEKVSLR